jgi:predicted membrane chloride channel (bestrophin family)
MLFIQLSAMATLVLRVDRYSPVHVEALRRAQQEEFSVAPSGIIMPCASRRRCAPARKTLSTRIASKLASVRARVTGVEARARPRALLNMRKNSLRQILSHRKASANGRMGTADKQLLSDDEIAFLKGFPCPVKAMVQRICRVVTTRQIAGGVIAPSPLVSRIFQELSNGSLAYEQCTRIKEVPVPFAYVQYSALLLLSFSAITPIAVACFTRNVVVSVLISILIVGGFGAMWLVANELEDPFGSDDNDLALVHYHDVFAQTINEMCQRAWLPKDQWIRANGPWTDPRLATAMRESLASARLSKAPGRAFAERCSNRSKSVRSVSEDEAKHDL